MNSIGIHRFGTPSKEEFEPDSLNEEESLIFSEIKATPDFHHFEETDENRTSNQKVSIEENLYYSIEKHSLETGVSVEALINHWLKQKIEE